MGRSGASRESSMTLVLKERTSTNRDNGCPSWVEMENPRQAGRSKNSTLQIALCWLGGDSGRVTRQPKTE